MPVPGLGGGTLLCFGTETSYGTALAVPTHKVEIIKWNVTPSVTYIPDTSLYSGVARRGLFKGPTSIAGSFTTRGNFSGGAFTLLWQKAMGSGSSVDTATNIHTMKEQQTLDSMTMYLNLAGLTWVQYVGVIITGVTLRVNASTGDDSLMTWEWSIIARSATAGVSAPTIPTNFPTLNAILFHQAVTVDDGPTATGAQVKNLEIAIANGLAQDRFYLGSTTVDRPVRNDFLKCTYKITEEFLTGQTTEPLTAALAGSVVAPIFKFSDGGGTPQTFEFKSNTGVITEVSQPVEGYGIVNSSHTIEAYNDGTSAIVLTIVNNKAAFNTAD